MIAAIVLLALVASSQVHAFPGEDPYDQFVDVHAARGVDALCLMGYIGKIQKLVAAISSKTGDVSSAAAGFTDSVKDCNTVTNWAEKGVCYSQAIRDAWEGSATLREEVGDLAKQAIDLLQEVQKKCLS